MLFGTLYPLFLEGVTGKKISVGIPFFNASFIPVMLPLVLVMAVGPFLSWKRAHLGRLYGQLKWSVALALIAGLVVWYIQTKGPALAVISMAIGAWLLFATLKEWSSRIHLGRTTLQDTLARARRLPRAAHGMSLAHAGLAVCVFGFVGSSAWKSEEILYVEPGVQISIAGFDLTFEGVEQIDGPNYSANVGILNVSKDGRFLTTLKPEQRNYPVAKSRTTEAAIRSTPAGDLYVSMTEPVNQEVGGRWTLRVLYEPLIGCVWLGSIMLMLGGLLSLSDRRLRVGAPKRTAKTASTPAVKGGRRMNRFLSVLPLCIALLIGAGAFWGLTSDRKPSAIPSALINKSIPEFNLPAVEGTQVPGLSSMDLKSYQEPVLVNFFASWCPPCRAEHAVLTRLAGEENVVLVGINYKDQPTAAARWLRELGNPYQRIGSDTTGRAGIEWGVSGPPETFIISRTGKIMFRYTGAISSEEAVRKVRQALQKTRDENL